MKLIGITGGVGSGKSEVLSYIKEKYNAYILLADELANDIKEPGGICYQPVIDCLGKDVVGAGGRIDKAKMAQAIFSDPEKLAQINQIIHPAVRNEIMRLIQRERESGVYDFFFLEAALLIEEHYDEVVDELWYIYAQQDVRRDRLKASRGYSDAKIDSIIAKQLSEDAYRTACQFVIDNSGDIENTKQQIDTKMEEYPCVKQK